MPLTLNPAPAAAKYLMACGDSKTAISDGRWRIYLQEILDSENKRVTWIGAVNGALNGDPVGMQSWHSAVSGATVSSIRTLVAGATLPAAPDVIIMWLGTNDLRAATSEGTIEAAYTGFIDDMHTRWPSAKIVCVDVDQNYAPDSPVYNPATFNAFIAGLPATYPTFVSAVNVHTNLGFSSFYADGLHPLHPPASWIVAMQIWQAIDTFV